MSLHLRRRSRDAAVDPTTMTLATGLLGQLVLEVFLNGPAQRSGADSVVSVDPDLRPRWPAALPGRRDPVTGR